MTHENYWRMQGTIRRLRKKDNTCFVCGSTENIVPHHIKKVNPESDEYFDESNLVLLCDFHHHLYHRQYPDVNAKTFSEFLRDNHLKRQRKKGDNMDFKLDKELKVSKLKKIFKLLNKTSKKLVKISADGKAYDITKIISIDGVTILELGEFKGD